MGTFELQPIDIEPVVQVSQTGGALCGALSPIGMAPTAIFFVFVTTRQRRTAKRIGKTQIKVLSRRNDT